MKRETSVLLALTAMLIFLGFATPSFFSAANLRDVLLSNIAVLIAAIGMTAVILIRQIDVSVGAQFAVCGIAAGLLAKAGLPMWCVGCAVVGVGALLGSINAAFVALLGLPSIVVTLAAMVVLRDSIRWGTGGAWVQGLPEHFQWFGLGQVGGECLTAVLAGVVFAAGAWVLGYMRVGRAVYATGSDVEAARLAGIEPQWVKFAVFVLMGGATALAALLDCVRFTEIQSNSGVGFELKVIAAVVVGGTSINGGRGSLYGTLLGVAILGAIGPALTFLGVNAFWEKAIQGAIILSAVTLDVLVGRRR